MRRPVSARRPAIRRPETNYKPPGVSIVPNITLRPDGDPSCFDTDKFKKACADPSMNILLDFTPTDTPQHNRAIWTA